MAAIVTIPAPERSALRSGAIRAASIAKTVDHHNATPQCISTPIAAVRVPPVSAEGPRGTAATPWKSRVTVEWYTTTLRTLEKSPSVIAVRVPARRIRFGILSNVHLQPREGEAAGGDVDDRDLAGIESRLEAAGRDLELKHRRVPIGGVHARPLDWRRLEHL